MCLTLSEEEADTLRRALASYVSDLRIEIRGTERQQMRERLKLDARQIESMLGRLSSPPVVTPEAAGKRPANQGDVSYRYRRGAE